MNPLIWGISSRQTYRSRKRNSDCQGLGGEEDEELLWSESKGSVMLVEEVPEICFTTWCLKLAVHDCALRNLLRG